MQLFFDPDISEGDHLLAESESKHLIRVLRKKEGDIIHVTDGNGHLFLATIVEAGKRVQLDCKLHEKKEDDFSPVHMIVCPTKSADRTEWFIEKAVELGVSSITPLISTNSERRKVKVDRWKKVAISAMKQSLKLRLPDIPEPMTYAELIVESEVWDGNKLLFHCRASGRTPFKQALKLNTSTYILIGPEGDFTEEEIQKAELTGWESTTLGDRRLRTETAALSALDGFHWYQNWMK